MNQQLPYLGSIMNNSNSKLPEFDSDDNRDFSLILTQASRREVLEYTKKKP